MRLVGEPLPVHRSGLETLQLEPTQPGWEGVDACHARQRLADRLIRNGTQSMDDLIKEYPDRQLRN